MHKSSAANSSKNRAIKNPNSNAIEVFVLKILVC
jgi:hypothetical protein